MVTTELDPPTLRERSSANAEAPPYKFSRSIWGIDWASHFPRVVTDDGVVAECGTLAGIEPFLVENISNIFEEDAAGVPFLRKGMTASKQRYYDECSDVFVFRDGAAIVGVLVCTPIDWSTYYLRLAAVLPRYHGRRLLLGSLSFMFAVLKAAGVERVEAETSPSNLAVVQTMTRMRFNVTGTVLTERWGALVRFTKFLDEESEGVFLDQFCSGIRYQARGG